MSSPFHNAFKRTLLSHDAFLGEVSEGNDYDPRRHLSRFFFGRNSDGTIDFSEFRALEKAFPLVCFPAFRLQDSLQEQFLGKSPFSAQLLLNT